MTCIVAVKQNGKVVMAGDSAGISGTDISIRKDPKVFKVGQFIIGFTSSFRMGQALMDLKVPLQKKDQKDCQYMRTTFINCVRKLLKEAGCLKESESIEEGGTFLVAYKGEIYRIESDFQVEVRYDSYNACGCGENYAIGALAVLTKYSPIFDAKTLCKIALETAEKYSAGVAGPWTIVVSGDRNEK